MRDAVVLALVFFVLSSARSAEWHVNNRHPACGDQNPGTIEQPFKTVGAANAKIQPGDSVLIYSGTYRERVEIAVSGQDGKPIVFRAAEGHYPIVTGADELLAWTAEDKKAGVYSAPWPHRFIDWSPTLTHPDDPYHRVIGRAENVWIDGYPLRQVLDAKQLARGTFFADLDKKRLLVCADHGGDISNRAVHCVEASVRADIWVTKGSHVHVRGLTFRYAANGAQNGAVKDLGAKNVYLDCVFEKSNGVGAAFTGNGTVVRRCVFHDHGQLGFAAVKAHNLTLTHCTIRRNNLKNYDRGWEAGANKLVLCRGVELAHSTFTDNYGNGVWFDIGNEDCSVHHCLIARNDGAGIFYEISHGLKAHDNVILFNGVAAGTNDPSWGANGGISLSSSTRCELRRNILIGNREGLQFREQHRTTAGIDDPAEKPIWNRDHVIEQNLAAFNLHAQVRGWFDIPDGRHWPRAMQKEMQDEKGGEPPYDLAAAYKALNAKGIDAGVALETLNIRLGKNYYASEPGQALFVWGAAWKKHRVYKDLATLQRELAFETDSKTGAVPFANSAALDLRVPAGSPVLELGCYPQGEVPGVRLGTFEPQKE